MAFEKKTWYNNGVVPDDAPEGTVAPAMSADNLNRIEDGVKEALDGLGNLKLYADKNIKSITVMKNAWVDSATSVGQIPNWSECIEKYQIFTMDGNYATFDSGMAMRYSRIVYIPFDTWTSYNAMDGGMFGGSYKQIYISSETGDIFLKSNGSDAPHMPSLFLIPIESIKLI